MMEASWWKTSPVPVRAPGVSHTRYALHPALATRGMATRQRAGLPACSTQQRRIDVVRDAGHAVALGHQGGGPRGDQDALRRGHHSDRLTIGTLEEMDLAHGLSGGDLDAEVDEVLV